MARHSIPERCNRPAHRMADNGYRLCPDHARVNDPSFKLYPNTVGPCDYAMDDLAAARYVNPNRVTPTAGPYWVTGIQEDN